MAKIKKEVTINVEVEMDQSDILDAVSEMCLDMDTFIEAYCFDEDQVMEWTMDNRRDEVKDELKEELESDLFDEKFAKMTQDFNVIKEERDNLAKTARELTNERDTLKTLNERFAEEIQEEQTLRYKETDALVLTVDALREERDKLKSHNVMLCEQFDEEHDKTKQELTMFKKVNDALCLEIKELKEKNTELRETIDRDYS